MPPKKISFKTTQQHQKKRLDHVLAECLPTLLGQPVSKGKVRKLIVAGAVYLNRKRVRIASKELMPNAQIDLYIDLTRLNSDSPASDIPFIMTEERVLFEDEDLIVVDKPPGLPTQPTVDEARVNLFTSVKKFLEKRTGSPHVYLGLHHRLDRDTSGVVLFTKSQRANPGIAEGFASRLVSKTYQALTIKAANMNPNLIKPGSKWVVKNFLGRSKEVGKKGNKYTSVRSGGDFAHTDFVVLEELKEALWIEAHPLTGRTHQIRVHLAGSGIPILGDVTYGGPVRLGENIIPRLMLHSHSLTFPHPIHKNEISIQSSLPEDFIRCIKALQSGDLNSLKTVR